MRKVFFVLAAIILISTSGNCQWYSRVYGVNELNQLTTEQLNNALKWTQRNMQTGKIISVIGAVGIIGGAVEVSVTNNEKYGFAILGGIAAILISVPLEITGLTIWGVNSSRKTKIANCLSTTKISLGFINDPTITMLENSDFNLTPAISVAISF
jgi:hypothetical protein